VAEIERNVDAVILERVLTEEGKRKFVEPQHALLKLIGRQREGRPSAAPTG
jgi:hypothetical protein